MLSFEDRMKARERARLDLKEARTKPLTAAETKLAKSIALSWVGGSIKDRHNKKKLLVARALLEATFILEGLNK